MPEPEFEIIQDTCFGYHYANPNGIGVVLRGNTDKDYDVSVTHIDLAKGEVTFKYTDLEYNRFIDRANAYIDSIRLYTRIPMPKLPYHRGTVVKKEVDLLKNKNIVYLDISKNPGMVDILDDARGIEYAGPSIYTTLITCNINQDTGVDIALGESVILGGENKNIRALIRYNSSEPLQRVIWRSNEFPYKNIAICSDSFRDDVEFFNYSPSHTPSISKTRKNVSITNNNLSLRDYVAINFNHHQDYYPEDQKRILVVSYDGDNTGKATPFFDLNSLSYKKGYIYRDVDLSKVQLDPQRVAKSKKITLYAFNGQTPFAGVGELAVK